MRFSAKSSRKRCWKLQDCAKDRTLSSASEQIGDGLSGAQIEGGWFWSDVLFFLKTTMDVTANGLGPGGLGPGGLDSVGIPESQKDWDFYLGVPRLNPQTTRPQTNKKNHYLRSFFAFHQQNSLLKELTNISPTGNGRFSSR